MTDIKKALGIENLLTDEELEHVAGGQVVCYCAYTDASQQFIRVNLMEKTFQGTATSFALNLTSKGPGYTIPSADGGKEMDRLRKMYPDITFKVMPMALLH